MNNANRIIFNTAVSYVALLLKLFVGLFSVRLVLKALGEENYGVFVIVGGLVGMLDILNTDMTNTSMRYLAHSLGNKDKREVYVTFNSTLVIHYIIGAFTVILLEIAGPLMFKYIVNIPESRMWAAKIIYQFMIVTTFMTVIAVPYDAVTNAHEKIWMLSVFDMVTVVLRLGIAVSLLYYEGDRLILYGLLLMLLQVAMRLVKAMYAKRHFPECRRLDRNMISKSRMREIMSYTGWNLFGSISALGARHLRSIVVNYFFGVRLNAAQGVANQVANPVNKIVTGMTRAINPQIMKSEGGGERNRMKFIVFISAKYSTFLMAIFSIPVILEAPLLLNVWLETVPQYAVLFTQISIAGMLMEKFTYQLTPAINAVGKIRGYQVCHAIGNLVYLPIAFVLFSRGYSPAVIYWLSFLSLTCNAVSRFYFGRKVAGILFWEYVKSAILPALIPMTIATVFVLVPYFLIPSGWINLVVVTLLFCVVFLVLFWLLGINKVERARWLGIFLQFKSRIFRKHKKQNTTQESIK